MLNEVAESKEAVHVTRDGEIIARIVPFSQDRTWDEARPRLAGSVLKDAHPTEPDDDHA